MVATLNPDLKSTYHEVFERLSSSDPNELRSFEARRDCLQSLRASIVQSRREIAEALRLDLGKSPGESESTEIQYVIDEIDFACEHLKSWMEPEEVTASKRSLGLLSIVSEPQGVVLIISPWNYPFRLALAPLVNAIAAGNRVILKPSEISAHTSEILPELVTRAIPPSCCQVISGGAECARSLTSLPVDHIFFIGSQSVGRQILNTASQRLTPVTLELGGKCPCIVDHSVDLAYASRRVVWGKFMNVGQTCVAPDYVLVPHTRQHEWVHALQSTINEWFGDRPEEHPAYGRIVSNKHFDRLQKLCQDSGVPLPLGSRRQERFIPPTILPDVSCESPLMQEEIFGPLLPVIGCEDLDDAIQFINQRPSPLTVYLFSDDSRCHQTVIQQTRSGSVCINDTLLHIADPALPFGGVGDSGMGRYQGHAGFKTFSNFKSVFCNSGCKEYPRIYQAYQRKQVRS